MLICSGPLNDVCFPAVELSWEVGESAKITYQHTVYDSSFICIFLYQLIKVIFFMAVSNYNWVLYFHYYWVFVKVCTLQCSIIFSNTNHIYLIVNCTKKKKKKNWEKNIFIKIFIKKAITRDSKPTENICWGTKYVKIILLCNRFYQNQCVKQQKLFFFWFMSVRIFHFKLSYYHLFKGSKMHQMKLW